MKYILSRMCWLPILHPNISQDGALRRAVGFARA